ncbi:MAG: hypothetical protein Q4G45_00615 [Actinomycetia bacterium]|nr:hypothetical protein [Actinomycetes bacterium]
MRPLRPGKKLKGWFSRLAKRWATLPDQPARWTFGPTARNPGAWELPGTKMLDIRYRKRDRADHDRLRHQFRRVKREFLEHVRKEAKDSAEVQQAFINAGMTKRELKEFIDTGELPAAFREVHHRLPLDDSGTNEFENLVIIKGTPEHDAITQIQSAVTEGMAVGEVRTVSFPMIPPNVVVWPRAPAVKL